LVKRFGYGEADIQRKELPVIWLGDYGPDPSEAVPIALSQKPGIAQCINNRGDIAGGLETAVLWKAKHMRPARLRAARGTFAIAIKDSEDIIGYVSSPYAPPKDPFFYHTGKVSTLPTLGGKSSLYLGLNNKGEIVGTSQTVQGQSRPCLWKEEMPVQLETLGGEYGEAFAINDQGLIIGEAQNAQKQMHPCLWRNGKAIDLNSLIPQDAGWELTTVAALNNRGQIAGVGKHQGKEEAFLLTPTSPSP
jgi:probable HAF family extracellular repeat protein